MGAEAEESRQETGVGDDVPAEGERDVFVRAETVSVVPEVIFGVHVLEVQHGVLASQNDFVPEHDLKEEESLIDNCNIECACNFLLTWFNSLASVLYSAVRYRNNCFTFQLNNPVKSV